MKLCTLHCLLLFFSITLATAATAQHIVSNPYVQPISIQLPNIELGKAQYQVERALKESNSPLLIEALSDKIHYQLRISQDSIPSLINEVENIAKETHSIETKSLLASLTASLYLAQYERNSHIYNQRTPIVGDKPTDILEWSGVDFFETIYRDVALSVAPLKSLQEIPALPYCRAVARWELPTCNTSTTLYDIVALQAINTLKKLPRTGVANYLPQHIFESEVLFAPLERFLEIDFAPYHNQVAATILHLYQRLLTDTNHLVTNDLARIEYSYWLAKNPHRYNLYLAALQQLLDSNHGSKQVEVVDTYAQATLRSSNYEVLFRTLTLCQEAIESYPNHPLAEKLKQYVEQLTAPTFTIDTTLSIYPEQSTLLPLSYNNIGELTIQLYNDSAQLVEEIKQPCSDTLTLISQESTLQLPPLSMGRYELVVYPDTLRALAQSTTVHVTHYTTAIVGRAVVVTDSRSGKPQQGVSIELYQDDITYVESLITDKKGVAVLPSLPQLYGVKATKGEDRHARITRTPYNYAKSNERIKSDIKQCALFTDRSLYRPNDTVAYTGILYKESEVLSEQGVTLYLYNSKSQLLATQQATTDIFGGFNGTFHLPESDLQGGYYICNKERSAYARFEVASYKQPTFEVSLHAIEGLYTFDTPITQHGAVEGYAGNLLAGATVRYTVSRKETPYSQTTLHVADGEVLLDPHGEFSFSFIIPKGEDNKESYEVTATVTSLTGESVTTTQSVVIASSPIALSVSMPSYVERTADVPLAINVSNNMQQPVAGRACEYRLYTLTDSKGESIAEYAKGKMVSKVRFTSCNSPTVANWEKMPSGAYLLEVVVYESSKQIASQESRFILYSQKDKYPPIYTPLWMPQQSFSCKQGDKVKVLIGSSNKDSYLSYLLFDGYNLVENNFIKRSNSNKLLTIDYKASYGEELQLVVMCVKSGKYQLIKGKIKRTEEEKKLTIRTENIRDFTTPGAGERWQFTVDQHNGTPAKARFMATLFDASLLALNTHKWQFAPNDRYTNYSPAISWSRESEQSRLSLTYRANRVEELNSIAEPLIPTMMDRVEIAYGTQTKKMVTGALSIQEGKEVNTPFAYRRNFKERAAFYPDLTTNEQGEVTMVFTLPDAATTWQLFALAYTEQLAVGELQRSVVAKRALLVKPYLPRFVREGDRAMVTAEVSNLSDTTQKGDVTFELYHPTTQAILASCVRPFSTLGGESSTVQFELNAPQGVEVVGVRVHATSGDISDGEEHLFAVLPNSRLVTETLPFVLAGGDSKGVFNLDKLATNSSTTRNNYRLTLNYTAHPIWYAVQALPSLAQSTHRNALAAAHSLFSNVAATAIATKNPLVSTSLNEIRQTPLALDDNENLKTTFLAQTPWVLEATTQREQLAQLASLLDSTATTHHRNKAMAELLQQQQNDGGWAWYSGMPSNPHITVEIATLLAELKELGMTTYNEAESKAQLAALYYLDSHLTKSNNRVWVAYLYLRSLYQDMPLGDALDSHKTMMEQLARQWHTLPLVEQAKAAQIFYRYGNKELAQEVIAYLLAHATSTHEQGMFWANNPSSSTAMQSTMLAALAEIEPSNVAIAPIKQHLVFLKQTTHWGNPTATVQAVHALLSTSEDWLLPSSTEATISWGGSPLDSVASPLIGYIEECKQSEEIAPALATVSIERETTTQPAWGGLYWQYFEKYDQITASTQQQITLEKRLYIETPNRGLTLITDTTHLHIGDRVVVQLVLQTTTDLDFVQLQDERAAALAPTQQLARYRCSEGACYYQEPTETATNIYIDHLPKGVYLFDYTLVVEREGSYNNGIATAQCLYAPQMAAHTAGRCLTIAGE